MTVRRPTSRRTYAKKTMDYVAGALLALDGAEIELDHIDDDRLAEPAREVLARLRKFVCESKNSCADMMDALLDAPALPAPEPEESESSVQPAQFMDGRNPRPEVVSIRGGLSPIGEPRFSQP